MLLLASTTRYYLSYFSVLVTNQIDTVPVPVDVPVINQSPAQVIDGLKIVPVPVPVKVNVRVKVNVNVAPRTYATSYEQHRYRHRVL